MLHQKKVHNKSLDLSELSFSLKHISDYLKGELDGDPDLEILGLCSLEIPKKSHITFLADKKHLPSLSNKDIDAVIISKPFQGKAKNSIIVDDPYLAFAKVSQLFRPRTDLFYAQRDLSYIDDTCKINEDAVIGKNAYLSKDVIVRDGVKIGPNVFIGPNCIIGKNTTIHSNSALMMNVEVGEDCLIHPNVSLGIDGFGFAPSEEGYEKIEQLGGLLIGNNVEIGSGSTIDRGTIDNTEIHDGVKLDNLVHIAHNVILGKNSAIAASCAIAGSARIGQNLRMGGLSGILGHLNICDNVSIGAHTLITKDITTAGEYVGIMPAQEHKDWAKSSVFIKKRT